MEKKGSYLCHNEIGTDKYVTFSKMKYICRKAIFTNDSLESAFKSTEKYIFENFQVSHMFLYSAWRFLPASENQKNLLLKWNISYWEDIEMGEAADLILKRILANEVQTI